MTQICDIAHLTRAARTEASSGVLERGFIHPHIIEKKSYPRTVASAEVDVQAGRKQLERILASPGFARNERLSRFLQFVVERHFEGKDGEIKESVIAVEVLGRRPDYDPKQDSIVRTEAARLRARLSEYYIGEGKHDPWIIELPKGGYAPVFIPAATQGAQSVNQSPSAEPEDVSGEVPMRASMPHKYWHARIAQIASALAIALSLTLFLARHNWERERDLKLRQLTTNNGENFVENSVVSPDGRYLLYGDRIGVHLRVIATGETHTFEKPKALSAEDWWYPTAWYPDQTHFVAVSEKLTPHGLIPTSWIVSALGDGATELRDKVIARSISPDGALVAFTSGGINTDQEIGIMGARGEDPRIVSAGDDEFRVVQWSPDGRRLYDLRTRWLGGSNESSKVQYVIESRSPEGGAATPVVSYAIASDFPDWRGGGSFCVLADGRVIYTLSVSAESLAGNDDTNLWEVRVNPETGKPQREPRPLTNWFGHHVDHVSVSRDGKTLVLQKSNWQLHTYIGEIGSAGRLQPLYRMTLEDSDDLPYSWTPDSRAVIFTSNRTGAYRLYRQLTDTKVAEPLTTGPDVTDMGELSPDGQSIIYNTDGRHGRPPRVMRIAISGGAPHLIMETRGTAQIHCPRAGAARCITLEEGKPMIFRSFDPVDGNPRELFKLLFWDGGWAVSPGGSIGILRQDTGGGRVQIFSQSGSLEREIKLAPWSNFSGLNWSSDPREMYTASVGPSGATVLRVNLSGRIEPLWLLKDSRVTWVIAAPDGHHLAVLGKSSYSNVWALENF